MKKLIDYFTPKGAEQIALCLTMLLVISAFLIFTFLFTFLSCIYELY